MGSLVDRFGRRKLMLVATTIAFSMASVLSGFASGFAWLLGARLLMGIAEGVRPTRRRAPQNARLRGLTQKALTPVSSRPMVSWWMVSVPS